MALIAHNSTNIRIGKLKAFPIEKIGDNSERRVEEARHGGKIILPSFVLRRVYRTNQSIMIFKLTNDSVEKCVFCGVITFDGEDKKVSVPFWVFKQLQIESGEEVSVELVSHQIEKGEFAQFEAITQSFYRISDQKTALEHCLRNYVCITRGDVISIYYNQKVYELIVCDTTPSHTIIINECNLSYDLKPETEVIELPEECDLDQIQSQIKKSSFEAFSGVGQTTNGTTVSAQQIQYNSEIEDNENRIKHKIGIPDNDYKIGTILFKRYKRDLNGNDKSDDNDGHDGHHGHHGNDHAHKSDNKPNQQNQGIRDNENRENDEQTSGSAHRRPVTRSQTQAFRDEANRGTTHTNRSSKNKKRKKRNNNED